MTQHKFICHMHRHLPKPLIELITPEDDLKEISMLWDDSKHQYYKTPIHHQNDHFLLDGWIESHQHHHHELLPAHSEVLSPLLPIRKKQPPSSPTHKHSASFTTATNFTQGSHPSRYHIRRVLSHEWESESKPIHHLEHSNRTASPMSPQTPTYKSQANIRELNNKQNLCSSQKKQFQELAKRTRRSSLDQVNYPLLCQSPEKKLTGAVGRVRRLMKIKLQREKLISKKN